MNHNWDVGNTIFFFRKGQERTYLFFTGQRWLNSFNVINNFVLLLLQPYCTSAVLASLSAFSLASLVPTVASQKKPLSNDTSTAEWIQMYFFPENFLFTLVTLKCWVPTVFKRSILVSLSFIASSRDLLCKISPRKMQVPFVMSVVRESMRERANSPRGQALAHFWSGATQSPPPNLVRHDPCESEVNPVEHNGVTVNPKAHKKTAEGIAKETLRGGRGEGWPPFDASHNIHMYQSALMSQASSTFYFQE